jgi:hypothetical protein
MLVASVTALKATLLLSTIVPATHAYSPALLPRPRWDRCRGRSAAGSDGQGTRPASPGRPWPAMRHRAPQQSPEAAGRSPQGPCSRPQEMLVFYLRDATRLRDRENWVRFAKTALVLTASALAGSEGARLVRHRSRRKSRPRHREARRSVQPPEAITTFFVSVVSLDAPLAPRRCRR